MSAYLLGVLTVPAVLVATWLAWNLLTHVGLVLASAASLWGDGRTYNAVHRDRIASEVATARRCRAIWWRGTYVLIVHGDGDEGQAKRLFAALQEHGPNGPIKLEDLPFIKQAPTPTTTEETQP